MSSQLLKILQTAGSGCGDSNQNQDGSDVNRFDDYHPYWNLLKPFRSKFNKLMMILQEMEQHKYQPPKYSFCIAPLAEYFGSKNPITSSEITATTSIQQYDRSLSGSSRQQKDIQVNNLINNSVNRVTPLKTSVNKQVKRRTSAVREQIDSATSTKHQQQHHLLLTDSKRILQHQYKEQSKDQGRQVQITNNMKQQQRQNNNHNQSFSNISSTSSNASQPLTARKRSTENSKVPKQNQNNYDTPRSGATNTANQFTQNQPAYDRSYNQQQPQQYEYPDIASLQLNSLFKQNNRDLPTLEQASQSSRREYSSVDTESSIIFKQTNSYRLNSIRPSSHSNRKKVVEELVPGYSQNQDEIKIFKRVKNINKKNNQIISSEIEHYEGDVSVEALLLIQRK